jgi:hypothetical protein
MFGGGLIGLALQRLLPKHHLSKESQDLLKLREGVIATITALVLGLLVSSAKSSRAAAPVRRGEPAPDLAVGADGRVGNRGGRAVIVLFICAFSMSAAIFLVLEMNRPLDGSIKVSSAPCARHWSTWVGRQVVT